MSKYEDILVSAKKYLSNDDIASLEAAIKVFHNLAGNDIIRQLAISLEAIRIEEARNEGWESFKIYDRGEKFD